MTDDQTMTARIFAKRMRVDYRTALRWLRQGLVPGAVENPSPVGNYWEIPASALNMPKPKPGPKPKKKSAATKRKGAK